ncbi:hypothetical protein PIB30_006609 [Stylosanthes scabra]|uniref:Uncharacterized protein n=1 Tax=Stylosanthes scabra TaxID=79078 RepID=A0ABU6Z254_9FABA|nr:hypothetical protein [Stylosanthes scabra]
MGSQSPGFEGGGDVSLCARPRGIHRLTGGGASRRREGEKDTDVAGLLERERLRREEIAEGEAAAVVAMELRDDVFEVDRTIIPLLSRICSLCTSARWALRLKPLS